MKFKPQHDKVLIMPHDNLKESGSLSIPDSVLQKRRIGTVIAIGNGIDKSNPLYIKEGETVMYNINAGIEVRYEDKLYLTMSQEEILVVFEKKKFRILTTRIMILPDPIQTKMGELEIPRIAQQVSRKGTVVAVGEKIKDEMLPLKKGDYVAYYANAGSGLINGSEFHLSPDKNFLILRPQQIIGKFT